MSEPSPARSSTAQVPAGAILLIGAATLLFEILLTRVFSVTMWYHFAFVAVSLALFGIGASGVVVSLLPRVFTPERARLHLGLASLVFGLLIPIGFALDLRLPFESFDLVPEGDTAAWLRAHGLFAAKFLVLGAPFFCSGLVIALAFTHAPREVHRTYFFDLVGGGLGCATAVPLLTAVSGPTAILFAGALPCLAAVILFSRAGLRTPALAAGLAGAIVFSAAARNEVAPFVKVERVKSYSAGRTQEPERPKLYEKWHPVSRVAVHTPEMSASPVDWFWSEPFPTNHPQILEITNDAGARTFIYPRLEHEHAAGLFRKDASDLGHALLQDHSVLVIGVGGGKDVLAALHLGAAEVHAVELNPVMIDTVQEVFSDWSGGPYSDPRVHVWIDEGRSFVARHDRKFDLIKISATDTWAASVGGAYALNENYLYTLGAFEDFVSHLEPGGWLSISRFFPQETLRLVSLVAEGLRRRGHARPADHVLMARNGLMLTVLAKDSPVTPEEARRFVERVAEGGHVLVHAPGHEPTRTRGPEDEIHRQLLQSTQEHVEFRGTDLRVAPPTDDRPFFFNLVGFGQAQRGERASAGGFHLQHGRALALLAGLLQVTLVVALVFVVGPLLLARRFAATPWNRRLVANAYFLCLGLGYLLVEIPLMQRFTLYLGHPVHALSVVLFSMLVFSGIGSLLADRLGLGGGRRPLAVIALAVALLLVITWALPPLLHATIGLPLPARIALAVLVIAPVALLMGMPFPFGLSLLHRIDGSLVPWAWAVNGAASVAAPVLAMMLAISSGFSTAFLAGTLAYVGAGLLFVLLSRAAARTA